MLQPVVGELAVAHVAELAFARDNGSLGGAVESAEQGKQRGFAAARRSHDRDELAGRDLQRDPAERGHSDLAHTVHAHHVGELDADRFAQ